MMFVSAAILVRADAAAAHDTAVEYMDKKKPATGAG